ncbi:hypothetical protein KUV73_23500 [Mameliella alba]|nr:hypothetical protein [Mameliella alba]MBY6172279.1 hypothetical protein [Mameliella alba]MBY6177355.1 hypothetical protein [Mameliella alba]
MTGVGLTRRALMGSAAALAVMPVAGLAQSLNRARDTALFTSLLYALAGPVEVAPALLTSVEQLFVTKFGAGAVDSLTAYVARNGLASALDPQDDPTIEAQLQWLTAALFTGSADPSDSDARVVNYPLSLGWKSLSFAKAPGLCAGPEFGYWAAEWSTV